MSVCVRRRAAAVAHDLGEAKPVSTTRIHTHTHIHTNSHTYKQEKTHPFKPNIYKLPDKEYITHMQKYTNSNLTF